MHCCLTRPIEYLGSLTRSDRDCSAQPAAALSHCTYATALVAVASAAGPDQARDADAVNRTKSNDSAAAINSAASRSQVTAAASNCSPPGSAYIRAEFTSGGKFAIPTTIYSFATSRQTSTNRDRYFAYLTTWNIW
ncbi:hypothetical protein ATCCBAA256_18320 [Mycobacterium montefiorense]|nr:hypothetical protein ATCCBAA256_18320 [Mycobacterium montefiorense]